jgi:hypothetical protein
MKRAEHVAHIGGVEVYTGFWRGNFRVRDHLEDQNVDGKIILKWIFRNRDGTWTGLMGLRIETVGRLL